MLRLVITLFILAIISAAFGFTGIAGAATELARIGFFVFIVLLVISLLLGGTRRI